MKKVKIMGILNITPDSFFDGGHYFDKDRAAERAYEMKNEGADIIDIGGESTRPGAKPVEINEEIDRVCPVIEKISADIGIPLSIDTYKSKVAEAALQCGAEIVNDISGLSFDDKIADIAAKYNAGIILMHIKGKPENMQNDPVYTDLLKEIYDFLKNAREKAVNKGIDKNKIIIDPGIGFGKTLADNYMIINNLKLFKELGQPVLVGLSRKSLIGKLYSDDSDRLPATIALNAVSVMNGADIIRVHDVKVHRLALDSLEMLKKVS